MLAVAVAGLLTACGSAGTTGRHAVVPIEAPCTQIAAVLSDGPDPGADPVGYAQAQVLQLRGLRRGLRISKQPLRRAIAALAAAYQRFSRSGGSAAAKQSVSRATHGLDALCPGAAG